MKYGTQEDAYQLKDPMERFYNLISVNEVTGCWEWQGFIRPTNGYAAFFVRTTMFMAHRFSYLIFNGELIKGLSIDHLCRVRHCVNPEHLEQVSIAVNIRRASSLRTHCKHGHEFSKENTYWRKDYRVKGDTRQRVCKTCANNRNREYKNKCVQ